MFMTQLDQINLYNFFFSLATKPSKDKDLIAFKLFAKLNSFSMNVWDEDSHIAEIKILGMCASSLGDKDCIVNFG